MWIGSKASGKYLALSLVKLYDQINAAYPHRDRLGGPDGSIGDESHQATASDHNPNSRGAVRAMDITHDPSGGFDSYAFAEHLRNTRDKRIRYVISNRRIFGDEGYAADNRAKAWTWAPYNGANPHDHHIHISVDKDEATYDDQSPWDVTFSSSSTTPTPFREPVLRRGDTGTNVIRLQTLIGTTSDGIFGPRTEIAVRQFQEKHGLVQDGIVGPYTWDMVKLHPVLPRPVLFQTTGKMSTFGGPKDTGFEWNEGLALFSSDIVMMNHKLGDYLLTPAYAGAPGLGRRLNPAKYYIACRWNPDDYPMLRDAVAHVSAEGKTLKARPVDWGPNINTDRVADLSPGLAEALGLDTDDECTVVVYRDGK